MLILQSLHQLLHPAFKQTNITLMIDILILEVINFFYQINDEVAFVGFLAFGLCHWDELIFTHWVLWDFLLFNLLFDFKNLHSISHLLHSLLSGPLRHIFFIGDFGEGIGKEPLPSDLNLGKSEVSPLAIRR